MNFKKITYFRLLVVVIVLCLLVVCVVKIDNDDYYDNKEKNIIRDMLITSIILVSLCFSLYLFIGFSYENILLFIVFCLLMYSLTVIVKFDNDEIENVKNCLIASIVLLILYSILLLMRQKIVVNEEGRPFIRIGDDGVYIDKLEGYIEQNFIRKSEKSKKKTMNYPDRSGKFTFE